MSSGVIGSDVAGVNNVPPGIMSPLSEQANNFNLVVVRNISQYSSLTLHYVELPAVAIASYGIHKLTRSNG